jgi:lipopolysaccharide export system permease protein
MAYYILLSLAGTLAEEGTFPAYVIYWLPNLIFFVGGAYLVYCTANEKNLMTLNWVQGLQRYALNLLRKKGKKQ